MERYLLIKARNTHTGITVKAQDLTGARIRIDQRSIAEDLAQQFAQRQSRRTGHYWEPIVEEYTPSQRLI